MCSKCTESVRTVTVVIKPFFFMFVDSVGSPTRHQSLPAIVTFNVLFTPVVENLDNSVDDQALFIAIVKLLIATATDNYWNKKIKCKLYSTS